VASTANNIQSPARPAFAQEAKSKIQISRYNRDLFKPEFNFYGVEI
jgi:hypothetical protein